MGRCCEQDWTDSGVLATSRLVSLEHLADISKHTKGLE